MRTVRIHIQESIIDHILVNSSDISHPLEYGYPDYEIHSSMQGFSDSERLMEHLLFLVISMLPADLGTIWSWDSRMSIPWTLPVVKSWLNFPHFKPHFKPQGWLLRLSRVISRVSPNQRCHVLRRKLICPQSPFKALDRQCRFLSMPKRHRAQTLSPRMSRHSESESFHMYFLFFSESEDSKYGSILSWPTFLFFKCCTTMALGFSLPTSISVKKQACLPNYLIWWDINLTHPGHCYEVTKVPFVR